MKQIDFDEARRFLHALGKPAGTIRLRAFYHALNPKKANDAGRKGAPSRSVMQQWQNEGRGVYVVINDGGDKDVEITTCRAFFCEWDDRPTEWQLTAWKELNLPEPTVQVSTGGKSIHSYWVLTDPITPKYWELIQSRLLDYADADRSIKNAARVMRLPGTYHAGGDGKLGDMCSIVTFTNNHYTVNKIEDCLPSEQYYQHEQPARIYKEQTARSIDEIYDALKHIPPRIPGTGTYHIYRNILWALAAELGDPDQAAALMQSHSPQWLDVYAIANSGGQQINANTFWYWARHYGWRPAAQIIQLRPQSKAIDPDSTVNLQLYNKATTEWLDLVVEHVFEYPAKRWICVDNILHCWDGTHYKPHIDEEIAPKLACFLSALHVIDAKTSETLHPWKRAKYVDEALIWMRRLLPPVEVNPKNAINCRNGIVKWSWINKKLQYTFTPHSSDIFFTYITNYDYDPNASVEHLFRLLEAVDPNDLDTLQRILGSGLDLSKYRATRGRPRAVLMIGEGSNGKDTIRTALRDTLGSRNFTSCSLADFRTYDQGRKFPIASLRGASVNWSSENSQFVHIDNLQSLKAAISGEELSFELKGIQESQFVPSALFVFNLNKDPSLSGDQVAIETRFHVFKFKKTFMATPTQPNHIQADPKLKDDPDFIQQMICPAFLNWLLEGLALSVADGIDYSSGKQAMEDVRRAGCHLWEFCDAIGLSAQDDGRVPVSTVYDALRAWYRDEGYLDNHGHWLLDPPADRTVKAPRLLVPALKALFPKLASERSVGRSRDRLIMGLALDT